MKFILTGFLIISTIFSINAQTDIHLFLSDIYIAPEQLAAQKIRSLQVISEYNDDRQNHQSYPELLFKILEKEFNSSGYCTYKKFADKAGSTWDYLNFNYNFERYAYNDKNQIIKYCSNDGAISYCQNLVLDSEGKILNINSGDGSDSVSFIWEKGKMIKSIDHTLNQNFNRTFDEKGRFSSITADDGYKLQREYQDSDEKTVETQYEYSAETLINKAILSRINKTSQLDYYCQLNDRKDTVLILKAEYNEHFHPIYISSKEFEYNSHDLLFQPDINSEPEVSSEPVIQHDSTSKTRFELKEYKVENYYQNGLLVKRELYDMTKREGLSLVWTEYVLYGEEPLKGQYWPERNGEEGDY